MYHQMDLYEQAQARHQDYLREAEQRRLTKHGQTEKPTLVARQLAKLGDSLLKVGEQLKKQRAPQKPGTLAG